MQAPVLSQPPRLRVGELSFQHPLKGCVIVGMTTAIDKAGPMPAPPTDKDPKMTLRVHGKGRVVVWIIHTFLVMHHMRLMDLSACVIVGTDHGQQVALASLGGASVDKKSAIHRFGIDSQRAMLGRVGAQAAGILGAMHRALAQIKPDAPVARDRLAGPGFGCLQNFRMQQDSEHGRAPQERGDQVPGREKATHAEQCRLHPGGRTSFWENLLINHDSRRLNC